MAAEIKDWNEYVNAGGDPLKAADTAWTVTPHTVASWLSRDIPAPDFLLGLWLSTSTRALLVGATGLGKTMLGLEIAFAVAAKAAFLHWTVKRLPPKGKPNSPHVRGDMVGRWGYFPRFGHCLGEHIKRHIGLP
jgi:AAA domain